MEQLFKLDLSKFISPKESALVGRQDAYNLRILLKERNYDLEALEAKFELIEILIPNVILTINRSFFLGAFADRIQKLGKSKFMEKYRFVADEYITSRILEHIDSALLEATPSAILNAK